MADGSPRLLILGTRGVPAAHGGFETFAEHLARYLVAQGWQVSVYCQRDIPTGRQRISQDRWEGIDRIHVEVDASGPKATLIFDWLCARDAATRSGLCLVLGYNGAVFLPYLRLRGRPVITNMDGIEWRRPKWGPAVRGWFRINEWIAARSSNRLVADHPEIERHLLERYPSARVTMIPYGGDPIADAVPGPVLARGLVPDQYLLSVSRIEPDNNILPIVEAFVRSAGQHALKLVILGHVDPETAYGRAIRAAANESVVFPGPIYDVEELASLRRHARAYMHGHMAGGTNPSLVEALWAGNAVVAHDNPFNRWTANGAAVFFRDVADCAARIVAVAHDDRLVAGLRDAASQQAAAEFRWADVFAAYEREFLQLAAPSRLPEVVPQLQRGSV